MQITINEIEIKAAIRNHVLGMIAVREDMRIDIDLKATRKEEGYTAVIDITPGKGPDGGMPEPEAKTEPAPAPAKEAVKAEAKAEKPKAVVETVAEPVEVAEPTMPETEVAPAVEAVAEPEPAPAKDPVKPLFGKKALKPTPAVEAQDNTAPLDESAEPKKDAPRSIFAGLPKPVNTKTEAA